MRQPSADGFAATTVGTRFETKPHTDHKAEQQAGP
jgi:hypothetical protein